jgi:signal transduction histidine kinase
MASIRTRLTRQYAMALIATLTLFAVAVFVARRSTAYRNAAELAGVQADLAVRILRREVTTGERITVGPGDEARLRPQTREILDAIAGYLVVFDEDGRSVYQSAQVNLLPNSSRDSLNNGIARLRARSTQAWTRVQMDTASVVMVLRRDADTAFRRFWVFAGTGASPTRAAFELLGSAVLVLPFAIGLSIFGAYRIAQGVVTPLESITAEVTAITDGRSLHRRLPVELGSGELRRLAVQLNSMIERLETSFGALRRFTADASHELKTPLAVLRSDVERAMQAPAHSTEQLVALEEALQETTRMATLVESLLTLARADEGRFDLHRELVALEPLARDVFETALILGEDAGLRVSMPIAENAIVLGDRTRLRQLFLNLITNAIKYTPRGGEVELALLRGDRDVTFSVRDTGIGIAAADLPYVFDRFYRADRVRSRLDERGGFGLGLSISQWIAQAHGGSLTVQSRLHRGSTFTVTLPVAPDDGTPDESAAPELARASAAS